MMYVVGALCSLDPRSTARPLGIDFESGEKYYHLN